MLKLPDGRRLTRHEVVGRVHEYATTWPCVFDLYDRPDGGPHDELLPIDLLALNALNGWGGGQPMTAMSEAWVKREEIAATVRAISSDPLEVIDEERLDGEAALVATAYKVIGGVYGFGDTTASKLLHRLRPNLAPIWDKRVGQWYDAKEDWGPWARRIYRHVREPGTVACLLAAREQLGCQLSLLRIWDVLLWQLSDRTRRPTRKRA